jgi:hypothetical protein
MASAPHRGDPWDAGHPARPAGRRRLLGLLPSYEALQDSVGLRHSPAQQQQQKQQAPAAYDFLGAAQHQPAPRMRARTPP